MRRSLSRLRGGWGVGDGHSRMILRVTRWGQPPPASLRLRPPPQAGGVKLESLIERFLIQVSQVFMLRVFDCRTMS
jgi:hypothetical protein